MVCHSAQYTPRVSNAIALHFPPAVNDCPSVSFTALLTAHFTLFTLFTLYPLHRSPNHLQLQSFLSITSHPLANSFVPNPNERGTPLSNTQFSFFHRIAHCTVYTPYCTLDTPHSTIHLTLHTLHLLDTTFHTWHCTLLTPCWVTDCMSLRTVHSTCFKRYCPPFSPCC